MSMDYVGLDVNTFKNTNSSSKLQMNKTFYYYYYR